MLYIINVLILLTLNTFTKDLSELETKQSINNLRYVSTDGKVTYYQSRSGVLSFSSNYKNTKLIELPAKTQYTLQSTDSKKNVLIEVDKNYFSKMAINKLKNIYISEYGSKSAKLIANGIASKLHLEDDVVSYYLPVAKKIILHDVTNESKRFVNVFNKISPYLRPTVEMLSKNEVIYNDLNEDAQSAVLNYSFVTKKYKTIFKSKLKSANLDFCLIQKSLYILETSQDVANQLTNIYQIETINNEDYKSSNLIYSSTLNDLGHLTCTDTNIYFVKSLDYDSELNTFETDIAKIDINTKVLTRFETTINPTQIIKMDRLILTTKSGKYFLVEGDAKKLTNDGIEKGAL